MAGEANALTPLLVMTRQPDAKFYSTYAASVADKTEQITLPG